MNNLYPNNPEERSLQEAVSGYVLDGQPLRREDLLTCGKNPGVLQQHLDEVKSSSEYLENQSDSRRRLYQMISFVFKATEIHIEGARFYPSSSIPHRGTVGTQTVKKAPVSLD